MHLSWTFESSYLNEMFYTFSTINLKLKCVFGPCSFVTFWDWSLHFFCLVLVAADCKRIGFECDPINSCHVAPPQEKN